MDGISMCRTASSLLGRAGSDAPMHVRALAADEVHVALDWAEREGWEPGVSDFFAFTAIDFPGSFLGGFVGGRCVAVISVVNYDPTYAFIGFYIVHPDFRGRGLGVRIWSVAMMRAGTRTCGLDGVLAQVENYKASGFVGSHRNVRHAGPIPVDAARRLTAPYARARTAVLDYERGMLHALERYDAAVFGCARGAFVRAWLASEGHAACVAFEEGRVVGYAVLRPTRSGAYKVGPLFADSAEAAAHLLARLLSRKAPAGSRAYLDTPEPNAHAMQLAERLGFERVFETARMYRPGSGRAAEALSPPTADDPRVFGVTSFELG